MLEAVRRQRVKRLVHTSTSEVYGTPTALPIREDHPLNAQSPYAATKVAADQLALSYQRSFGVPVTILRPFNTFGPRQSTRAVISTIIYQLVSGKRQIQLGRLDTRRDFTFVTDTVAGFVAAGQVPDIEGKAIQLGTGTTVSIEQVFHAICEVLGLVPGKDAAVIRDERRDRPDQSEVLVLQSDYALAKATLGWAPAVNLTEGLARTVEWVKANLRLFKDALHV